jgi:hypothetical protein
VTQSLIGWVLPFFGLVWGPGEWWEYLIWLAIGTVVIIGFQLLADRAGKED